MQHWRAQKVCFTCDHYSVRTDPVYRKLADDRFEFVRRSKYLYPRNGSADHRRVLIQHGNDALLLGSVGVKQLYERRGETICSDYDDALPATLMLRRLIVFAGHDAHEDPGREEPTREQQSVNERHRARDAIETRKREQHGES